MTARIAGFVSRADAGLRKPRSISRNISPSDGGVAFHYGGPASTAKEHADCVKQWRGWQAFHMDSRGWADIAYTMGVCQHGYAFAGRGAGVRTAANGTNFGNENFYAVCWLGGEGQTPTQAAYDAFEWAVLNLRKTGAGRAVRPHQFFKGTACPGGHLVTHAGRLHNTNIGSTAPTPDPVQEDKVLYVYSGTDGLDWGTDLFTRRPFESQEQKGAWITMAQRVSGKAVTRITLSPEEQELLVPVGIEFSNEPAPTEEVPQ